MYQAGSKKGHFEEKASKEEREYVKALNEENQAKSRREVWSRNQDIARKHHTNLYETNRAHNHLQAELDQLYNPVFACPTAVFPEEDEKKWKL